MTIKEMITRQQEITSLARSEGRDLTAEETREFNELQEKIDAARAAEPESQPAEPAAQPADAVREAREAERRRISDIGGLCRS